ncbi:formyl transferase [Marinobacter zhejiangensis]|uniref:phosphoribosylglycinamide formyltransferase 1 n=1 Tax=Marinobacter zhejiangensis TaxID=488535 RepID=A0A1I4RP72_9GAMM|nr:formyl transferase [Marinobacter zhejiangensis]SFM54042.1 Formyl transferase [Marinobacter zhejiangensis]
MRTVVVVSQDKSDIYFANQLMKALNVVGVVVENQTPVRDSSPLFKKAMKYISSPGVFIHKVFEVIDRKFVEPHQDYNKPENSLDFGDEGQVLTPVEGVQVLHTQGVNAINDPEYRDWIQRLRPDVIAVCGASIMRSELIAVPRHGVLNLHGGLSQFYRGLFTTDWAVHNRELECVGATVHFVSEGVDDGDIVYQGRPSIQAGDNPNTLYEKVVKLGVRMMVQAVSDIEQSNCRPAKLEKKGRLYLNSMFDTQAKRTTWNQLKAGVVDEYLSDKPRKDERVIGELINEFAE